MNRNLYGQFRLMVSGILIANAIIGTLDAFSRLPHPATVYHKQYLMIGELKLPKNCFLSWPIRAYFEGQANDPADDMVLHATTPAKTQYHYDPSFTITVNSPEHEIYLLITQRFHGQSSAPADNKSNIIEHLKLEHNESYVCFKCTRTFHLSPTDAHQEMTSWHIERVTLDTNSKGETKIPDNTVIVIADPEWIDSLTAEEWEARSALIKLPIIVFKQNVTQEELDREAITLNLSIIDHRPFHKPSRKEVKQAHPGLVICMSTPAK